MIHAGAGSGWGHSAAGGGAGGSDVQPLTPSVNISPKAVILNLGISHSSIRGPLGLHVSFVDFPHGGVAPQQDLARLTLRLSHAVGLFSTH
ncbi:hypothetical protein [Achromobacter insolitus]|uniref:hypothetical protein n=1 Tax=Achromobacter insolitus TaxID=217204 RepID=UPI001F177ADD|nr:hypothetical protein [Achromobacter insolitus]